MTDMSDGEFPDLLHQN